MLRIGLFMLTNLGIMAMLAIVSKIFGLDRAVGGLGTLLIYSAVIGFTGSMISLLLSKTIAKWTTGAQIIKQPQNETEAWLLATVKRQAEAAGIGMPDVAIYPGEEANAFATGAFRNSALVAVSVGLMQRMRKDEVEAVLAHEVSHIANGDMVTMALLQGVLNTFVVLISRIVAQAVDSALRRDDDSSGPGWVYFGVSMIMQMVLGVLASIVLAWFSRRREFRADAGAAKIAGAGKMVAALERLKGGESSLPQSIQAMGISGHKMMSLFSTHPPLDDRIAALRLSGAN